MKTINLFVACPKDSDNLKSLKEDIKKKCLDLNVYFADKIKEEKEDRKIKVIAVTYDDPERREEVCKQIIKHRADIVLFLFDDVYDQYLLDELEYAVEHSVDFNKPEPLVYVNKTNGNSTNEYLDKKIAEILAEGGWVYEPFYDSEDLWGKVLYKLERYFNQYYNIRRIQRKANLRYYGLRIGLPLFAAFAVAFAVAFFFAQNNAESKKLLIVGGGSALNYVEEHWRGKKEKIDLIKYNPKSWWYAPMPSGDSYRVIAEEIINIDKLELDYRTRPYYPIILSAEKAPNDSVFKKYGNIDFRSIAVVFGIQLGYDTLHIYCSKSFFDSTSIHQSTLDSLILNETISVYTTSDNSGTFKAYRSICPGLQKRQNLSFFSDNSIITDSSWIAIGSKYYKPQNDSTSIFPYIVRGPNNQVLFKPIYVYFVLYKDSEKYLLPNATKAFLDEIVPKQIIDSINNPDIINSIISKNNTKIMFDTIFKVKP